MVFQVNPLFMGRKSIGFLTVQQFTPPELSDFFGYSDGSFLPSFGDFTGSLAGFSETDVGFIFYSDLNSATFVGIKNGLETSLSLTIDGITEVLTFSDFFGDYTAYDFPGDPFDLQNKASQTLPVFGKFL